MMRFLESPFMQKVETPWLHTSKYRDTKKTTQAIKRKAKNKMAKLSRKKNR